VHVTDSGSGTPLVLLHAFPLDSRMWDAVRPELAEHVRVITPDQPGLGSSPPSDEEPSLASAAAEVVTALDTLGVDRAVVGGCSMGGYLAMAVLRAAPERVAGLVLVDTKPTADDDTARRTRLDMAERVLADGTGFLADESLPRLLAPIATAEVVGRVRALIDAQPATGIAWAQRAMAARPDSSALLAATDVPTLIVHGALDALMPVEIAHTTASLMSTVDTAVIADAGHLPPLETPAAFTTALIAWLAGVSV